MTHRSYKITPTDPWAAGVVGVNFDPSVYRSEVVQYRPGTLLVQDSDIDNGHMAGRLWQMSPFQGEFSVSPNIQELTPQNAINVVSLGADPSGRHGSSAAINLAIQKAKARGYGRVYLPAGKYIIDDTIVMDSLIWLHGDGMATYLRAKPQLNAPMIQAYWEEDVRFGYMQRLSDMRLDGNRDEQDDTDASICHGVSWLAPDSGHDPVLVDELVGYQYEVSQNYPGQWFDTNRDAFNLWISYCGGTGLAMSGRGGGHFHNITCYENQGYGFDPTYDTSWVACTAGRNGKSGFLIADSAIMLTGCKAWWSGYRRPADFPDYNTHGFLFTSGTRGSQAVNCEAQDNYAAGFSFANAIGHVCRACIADSNNRRNGDNSALEFYDSYANTWEGLVYDRYNDSIRYQDTALRMQGSTTLSNRVVFQHFYRNGGATAGGFQSIQHISAENTVWLGNYIEINNEKGSQKLSPAATVYPNIYHGGKILMNLTMNVTIGHNVTSFLHGGCEMELVLTQDATGGRTVSFDSNFRLIPSWTPDTTAFRTNVIKFRWNPESNKWVQISNLTGIV